MCFDPVEHDGAKRTRRAKAVLGVSCLSVASVRVSFGLCLSSHASSIENTAGCVPPSLLPLSHDGPSLGDPSLLSGLLHTTQTQQNNRGNEQRDRCKAESEQSRRQREREKGRQRSGGRSGGRTWGQGSFATSIGLTSVFPFSCTERRAHDSPLGLYCCCFDLSLSLSFRSASSSCHARSRSLRGLHREAEERPR